jgi:phosphoglycerate dehydrogenase-like enzyme
MTDSRPLVWLPFAPTELGEPPARLRYQVLLPEDGAGPPAWADEVEFYVPPYRFSATDNGMLLHLPRLKVVQTMTAGVDHVRPYVPDGVVLCNGRGIHDASTAELAVALVLASLRGIPDFVRSQDAGAWQPQVLPSLADRRVLIVGYGAIGEAVERRLAGFEVEITRVARSARGGVHAFSELPDLLPRADVVVVVVPLTAETHGMVDADFLARMPDGALLVNVARGPVVDTSALLAELRGRRLMAALDVTDPEPLPAGHPLWSAPGLLVSPHVGGASSAMWPRAYRLVRDQLERFACDRPLRNVMRGDY